MNTVKERSDNFIELIKRNDIKEIKEYFKRNHVSLNDFYTLIKTNKEVFSKVILDKNTSKEIQIFFMKFVGIKRKKITDLIKKKNLDDLKNYVLNRNIVLKDYNTRDFDLLLFSIENSASVEITRYIIEQCQYQTFNYSICNSSISPIKRTPLFCAICNNEYKLADILLEYKADINYSDGDILYYLFYLDLLECKNLRYVLKSGIKIEYIIDYFSFLIKNSPYTMEPVTPYLKTILNHYIYNTSFILYYLLVYKNKEPLSTQVIHEKIEKETNIIIKDDFYKDAVYYEYNEALEMLLKYDPRDKTELQTKIEEYKKLGSYIDEEEDSEDI
ncbi:hypothetical protein BCR32DRAFT_295345 [Anaeromyces robustus]|uniref:Uncharacterized protein n=1 Tax=Anaeromyces robustus TaxID=1754192 RepID=A0A1Y1WWE5_9FUNG|nr:hypothetical protein BCR32DRAFT_295345 [Anaeromyces robustus]|eukprot:ORX77877.1 hypothetical protein BCR32DRAFT_295345 [Anaeromyces robustus]